MLSLSCVLTLSASQASHSSPIQTTPTFESEKTIPSTRLARWYTADSSNPSELAQKEQMLARIDRFWVEFKKIQPLITKIRRNEPKKAGEVEYDWANEHVGKVHPELVFEFGPGLKSGEFRLDFTAIGHDEVVPIAKSLVERAPAIPHWTFGAYKSPTLPTAVEEMYRGRGHHKSTPQFHAEFKLNPEDNLIDMTLETPAATGVYNEDAAIALLLCDIILGEENSDVWLGSMEIKKAKPVASFDYSKQAVSFAHAFNLKKQDLLAAQPSVPYFKLEKPGMTGVFTFKPQGQRFSRRITMSTSFGELCRVLASGSRFHSQRFSKFGEKFAYLQVPDAGKYCAPVERGKIEDVLDSELRKAQAGCLFAGGYGPPNIAYFDLCLKDLNEAIPLIRKICKDFKLSCNSNLRFYDCDWLNEWVGMYDETPKPEDLARPWFYNP